MAKSDFANRNSLIDPRDLIDGTVKLDGERSHGYGLDTMRLWAISKDSDSDCYLERDDIEQCNQDVKMLRGLIKLMLGNLYKYDSTVDEFDFNKLTFVDKVMACKLLKYLVQTREAYENFEHKKVYELTLEFLTQDVTDYYLPVSRERLLTREGSTEHMSA